MAQYATPRVGREIEIANLRHRLRDPICRLLTFAGPGGIGKMCLAIEAASLQAHVFQDEFFIVPLQPVAAVDNILHTLGRAIGYEFTRVSAPEVQLHQHLRSVGPFWPCGSLLNMRATFNANFRWATAQPISTYPRCETGEAARLVKKVG